MAVPSTGLLFISYAHNDGSALAERISRDLGSDGYRTWLDRSRLAAGATWSTDIERALDECEIVLALLSAGSFRSDICRAEQLRALRHGKRVIPIGLADGVDRPLFLETKQYISFAPTRSYEDARRDLVMAIADKESPTLAARYRETYVTAPRLRTKTVPRPLELEVLRSSVLRDGRPMTIAAVAVMGMGGIGKSTLVQMLCHEQSVQAAFPDGVIWVSLGRDVADVVPKLREVGKALGDDLTRYDSPDGASNQLRTCLRKKTALVVLDDVWHIAQVEPFLADAPNSCLLFTTRMHDIATSLQAVRVDVGTLSVGQSLEVLARWTGTSPIDLPPEATAIVQACGRLPLALAMIGGLVRGRIDAGRLDAWATAIYNLETAQLDRISFPLEDYPYPELQRAIQVSVDVLGKESRARYLGMGVFPEDTPVPERVFETLWKVNRFDVQETVDSWIRASLAHRFGDGTVVLHDLQLDYVRRLAGDGIVGLHQHLVDRYADARRTEWPAGQDDGYFYQRVTWHLAEAQNWRALADLLLNPAFIRAKLDALAYLELSQDFRWVALCRAAIETPADRELLDGLEREVSELRMFVDRVKETAAIEDWVASDEDSFLAIVGRGGIGKTWFLRSLWVRNFRHAVFHQMDLVNRPGDSWRDLVGTLCSSVDATWDSRDEARSVAEVCDLARHLLERLEVPTCVLVDGFDEFDSGSGTTRHELLECLRRLASTRVRFVISSRLGLVDELIAKLPGVRQFHLTGLPHEAATNLLLQLIRDHGSSLETSEVEALLQRADGNPFMVSLMADALKEGASPSSLLEPVDTSYLIDRMLRRAAGPSGETFHGVLRQFAATGSDVVIEDIVEEPGGLSQVIEAFQRLSLFELTEEKGRHVLHTARPDLLAALRKYYQLDA